MTIGLILALLASSCMMDVNWGSGVRGNGVVEEETRPITEDFTAVMASEGLNVIVSQGAEFGIRVEADENVIELIGTDIRDGKLKIHAIKNIGQATKNIYVTLPEITALYASSGADLQVRGPLETDKIRLDASSGADLHADLIADEVEADCSSGAEIRISGRANMLKADASSGADIKAQDLEVKVCHADASSGADIRVLVSESLMAEASSGGDVHYSGDARVETKKSASGSVHKY